MVIFSELVAVADSQLADAVADASFPGRGQLTERPLLVRAELIPRRYITALPES